MRRSLLVAAMMLAIASPVLAQSPAVPPTTASKVVDAAGTFAGKILGTAPPAQSAKAPLVNINKATAAELDDLPEIGVARSKAIIGGRPYKSALELLDRKIIPAGAYAAIKDKITIK